MPYEMKGLGSSSSSIPVLIEREERHRDKGIQPLHLIGLLILVALSTATLVLAVSVYHNQTHQPPTCQDAGKKEVADTARKHVPPRPAYDSRRPSISPDMKYKEYSPRAKLDPDLVKRLQNDPTPFSLDDIYNATLLPRVPLANWLGESNQVSYISSNLELVALDVETGEMRVLMDTEALLSIDMDRYYVSANQDYILLAYELVTEVQTAVVGIFAKFKIYDIAQQQMIDFPADPSIANQMLLYAEWTPQGNGLTFVYLDDLYYQATPFTFPERLTTVGENEQIRAGIAHFNQLNVYYEQAQHWWSPDMRFLAYGHFDSSKLPKSDHPVYGPYDRVYPYTFRQLYQKAGDQEGFSNALLHVIDMSSEDRVDIIISPPFELRGRNHYFYKVRWRDSTHLYIAWCNRAQTYSYVEVCNVISNTCVRNHETDFAANGGWILGEPTIHFIDEGEATIALMPRVHGELGQFSQVSLISTPVDGPGTIIHITQEPRHIGSIVGYDRQRHLVYYVAKNESALDNHLFRVGTPAADPNLQPITCLTCSLAPPGCKWSSPSLSQSTNFLFLTCLGPDVPSVHVYDTWQGLVKTIEGNDVLRQALTTKLMPTREYHFIDLADGYKGWVELVLPPGYVSDGSIKYPLLLYAYGGPHGMTMANYQYRPVLGIGGGWDAYLASSHGVVIARIDQRGSGGRGDSWMYHLYRRLGTYEIQDQIAGARFLRDNFPYIDGERIAVWGWSFGGFTTSMILGDPQTDIMCGLAVAPVTSWRYQSSGYTERYMGLDTPEDNEAAYNASECFRHIENYAGKQYFIAHGTLDDNVHFQHAAQMIKALTDAQVIFTSYIYVDENHSILSYLQNRHLFLVMTDFLTTKCFAI